MSGMLIALAMFGCSDDASYCQRLTAATQTYESRLECEAAQDEALGSDAAMEADFPTVIVLCTTPVVLARLGPGPVDLATETRRLALVDQPRPR